MNALTEAAGPLWLVLLYSILTYAAGLIVGRHEHTLNEKLDNALGRFTLPARRTLARRFASKRLITPAPTDGGREALPPSEAGEPDDAPLSGSLNPNQEEP